MIPAIAENAGVTRLPAPLECVAADALAECDPEAVTATLCAVVLAGVPVLEGAAEVGPPIGAVDWPSIWAWTVELKVPVMPAIVNLAEKARAGYCGVFGSFVLMDWKRMKYSLLLGPIEGSGVNWIDWVVDTSTLEVMVCKEVCCNALPTYMETIAGPNS